MVDRSGRLLADCLLAAEARRTRAEAAHAIAARNESDAVVASQAAAAALRHAAEDWTRQVTDGFDPMLGTLLGREVLDRAEASGNAVTAKRVAEAERARTAEDWRSEEGRRRALEDEAAVMIRRAARRSDERLLSILADRETFARRGR